MALLAILSIIVLFILALFHFYWAGGGKVGVDKAIPTQDGVKLMNPGKAITILVGLILLFFAYVAYMLGFEEDNSGFIVYVGYFISILFYLRAIGDFNILGFFKKVKSTEFGIYDTYLFSPLCLFFGIVFTLLAMN